MGADLPLVARSAELAAVAGAVEAATHGHGEALLITGEAGIGKTRLLLEARRLAEERKMLVLRGRALEAGGAYRPLVEAFALAAAPFARDPDLAGVRPTLARVLPGWVSGPGALAPMADPAAVVAGGLILLLQAMAPQGAALIIDDLHWADEDTFSVLTSLVDSLDDLPVALILAARAEPLLPAHLERLVAARSVRLLPLRRLTAMEVGDAVRAAHLTQLTPERLGELVAAADGLPLVLDELVRQLRESQPGGAAFDLKRTTLAAAVQLRLTRVSPDCQVLLDALSVVGECDPELLNAVTGLDDSRLTGALHGGLASTLLVTAATPLGVNWRHPLVRDAVRDRLLPLEQQAIARRAADYLAAATSPNDARMRQAGTMYVLAGYPQQAAQQLLRAARAAVRNAALGVAEQYLAEAHLLTGTFPDAAQEVLIERIETLTVAGRAGDAYRSGMTALDRVAGGDARALIVATARAAYGAGLRTEGAQLLARLENESRGSDPDLAVLRAHAALAERRPEAIELGEQAALQAEAEDRFDVACEALVAVGFAARRRDLEKAAAALQRARSLAAQHGLSVWEVRALAELGTIDMMRDSESIRLEQARDLAIAAGMVGTVAEIDLRIGEAISTREGMVAAYPTLARADAQARQLQLVGLLAQTRAHVAGCIFHTYERPLPGETRARAPSEFDTMIAEALELGQKSKPVPWARGLIGLRAWFRGDSDTAIELVHESLRYIQGEVKITPWWGVAALIHVASGAHPQDAFGPKNLFGHHVNWAAHAYATALVNLRNNRPATAAIAEAEYYVRNTPFSRHLLRTIAAPGMSAAGIEGVESWLREADAFCSERGELALQRRVRQALATIGAKIPRTTSGTVPPHLARLGLTAREAEILRLVNAGLHNTDIADRLFISLRTVESHVSSILQKTGKETRDQLPSATAN